MDSARVMSGIGQSSDAQVRPSIDIRILVVDDDSTTLAIVSSILQIFSYKVETAKNPLDALATLRMQSGYFDLVVTDFHMPYMNGFELKKQVDKEFKLPVILMTADDQENVMLQSLESGIALFIPKPVNPTDLKDLWQYAVRTQKGKSVVIEEIGSNPINPPAFDDDDDLQGHQSPSGPGSSCSSGNAGSSATAGALIPRNQPGNKRGGRSPPPNDNGKNKGSTSTKKSCCRPENRPAGTTPGRGRRPRRPKVVWTNSLHNRFLLAVQHLSFDKAVPKRILEFMNVPGLTRENVASHLQKYRLFLKKVAENGTSGASRMLADRILLRSSFASGYPIQMMLQTAQQLYPQLSRPSQQSLFPPPPPPAQQSQSQSQSQPNNGNNIPSSAGPVGISTLLTNHQPAPANVVQQPLLGAANVNAAATSGNVVASTGGPNTSYAFVSHGGNNGFSVGVNPMQAWQQQNQARVGPFAGTTYPSNNNSTPGTVGNNVAPANNYVAPNNSSGIHMIGGNMAGHNQLPASVGVPNGINGTGGRRLIGMRNGLGPSGNIMNGVPVGNMGSGNVGYGQAGGAGAASGGFQGANNPPAAPQAPQVLPNIDHRQQNVDNGSLPPPPPPPRPQYRLANLGRENQNNNDNNNADNELGDVVDNNDPAFGSGGVFLNLDNLPPPNYQALIEDIPSDLSDISFEEDNDHQVNTPTNQVQNPDPLAAGPSVVQENAPNLEQSLGLQSTEQALLNPGGNVFPSASENYFPSFVIPNQLQPRMIDDLTDPFQLMHIANMQQRDVDWDEFMDAMMEDD